MFLRSLRILGECERGAAPWSIGQFVQSARSKRFQFEPPGTRISHDPRDDAKNDPETIAVRWRQAEARHFLNTVSEDIALCVFSLTITILLLLFTCFLGRGTKLRPIEYRQCRERPQQWLSCSLHPMLSYSERVHCASASELLFTQNTDNNKGNRNAWVTLTLRFRCKGRLRFPLVSSAVGEFPELPP